MPKITTAIGEAGFELVRNRIGEILITELAEQHTLNPISGVTNATVYIERFRSFDNVEVPAVNVTIASDEFGQRTAVSGDGTVTYNIDCYTSAPTTAAVAGDTSAMVRLQRLLGICRAILMDSRYIRLDFAAPFVMSRAVTSMQLAKPQDATDGLSMVMGRLVMTVRVPEEVSQAVLLEIAGYDTQVKLGLTKKGYVFSGDNIPVPPFTGSEVSVNGVLFALVECGEPLNIPLVNSDGNNVGLVNFGDDVVAPDATYTLINTAVPPATLDSGSIPSGGDLPIVAPPATVKLVDTADNQLAQVTAPSGVMTDVTAPDATLKLNNSLTTYPIRSGELYNMLVRLNGQVPQTFSYTPGTKTLDVISPLVSLAVSDNTPPVGSTITLTATPTGFTATNYLFFARQGNELTFIGENAGGVLNWVVNIYGTFSVFVQADDATASAFNIGGSSVTSPSITLNDLVLWGDPHLSGISGTSYPDLSPTGANGTLFNSPTVDTSLVGGHIALNGVNQYARNFGSAATYSFVQNTLQFTMGAWIYSNAATGLQHIMTTTGGSGGRGFLFSVRHTANELELTATRGVAGTAYTLSAPFTMATGQWYRVDVTCDGIGTGQIYINGVAVTTTITNLSYALPTGNSTNSLLLGVRQATLLDGFWAGRIGPFHIYNRELSGAEVMNNVNADGARYGI